MSVFLSCLQAESAINPCPFPWTARRTALGQMPVSRVSAARWSIKSVCRYLGPALNHLQPEWSPLPQSAWSAWREIDRFYLYPNATIKLTNYPGRPGEASRRAPCRGRGKGRRPAAPFPAHTGLKGLVPEKVVAMGPRPPPDSRKAASLVPTIGEE